MTFYSTVYYLRELSLLPILNWFEVGLALGLNKYELDVIQIDNRDDVTRQRTEMFDLWLRNGEVTGEVLVKALVDSNNIEAALKLYDIKGKTTVNPLNNGHAWDPAFVPCREVVFFRRLFCMKCELLDCSL